MADDALRQVVTFDLVINGEFTQRWSKPPMATNNASDHAFMAKMVQTAALSIALASGIGTALPQREEALFYHQRYDPDPCLGLVNGDRLLWLQLAGSSETAVGTIFSRLAPIRARSRMGLMGLVK